MTKSPAPRESTLHSSDPIPADVHAIVQRYLYLIDEALPISLQALYLVGSIALDDYRPGRSDVDFVAVTAGTLPDHALDSIQSVHETLHAESLRPEVSGIYITHDSLQSNPLELSYVPFILEGRFQRTGGFEANPAVWLTLRNYPRAMRGTAAPFVWHDSTIVRRWTMDNLNSYWAELVSQLRPAPASKLATLRDDILTWCVPGVARLHYTIATGDITSKSNACRYALERFPERWHPVITEALALRAGENVNAQPAMEPVHGAVDFMQWVIDDAHRLTA
jgi:Domain of unknown function (DUF4111)